MWDKRMQKENPMELAFTYGKKLATNMKVTIKMESPMAKAGKCMLLLETLILGNGSMTKDLVSGSTIGSLGPGFKGK